MNRRHQRHNTTYKPPFRLKNRRVSSINHKKCVKEGKWKKGKCDRETSSVRFASENPWRSSVTHSKSISENRKFRAKTAIRCTIAMFFMNQLQAMTFTTNYREFYHPRGKCSHKQKKKNSKKNLTSAAINSNSECVYAASAMLLFISFFFVVPWRCSTMQKTTRTLQNDVGWAFIHCWDISHYSNCMNEWSCMVIVAARALLCRCRWFTFNRKHLQWKLVLKSQALIREIAGDMRPVLTGTINDLNG